MQNKIITFGPFSHRPSAHHAMPTSFPSPEQDAPHPTVTYEIGPRADATNPTTKTAKPSKVDSTPIDHAEHANAPHSQTLT